MRTVNSRFLDAKLQYRGWADPLGVHCGENGWENTRDITMLLGEDPETHLQSSPSRWSGRIEPLHRDLTGAGGWTSARELFATLNQALRYVVVSPGAPIAALEECGECVELLTDRYSDLYTILGARHRSGVAPPDGGTFRLSVRGRRREVILRRVGDQLVSDPWALELLDSRELDPLGFYRLTPLAAFELQAYRALLHRARLSAAEREALSRAGRAVGAAGWTADRLADPEGARELLQELLEADGRAVVRPRDLGIYFNHRRLGRSWPIVRDAADAARGRGRAGVHLVTGSLYTGYHRARDRVLAEAPWIRQLRPSTFGRRG